MRWRRRLAWLVAPSVGVFVACGDSSPSDTAVPIASLRISTSADSLYLADTLQLGLEVRAPNGSVLAGRAVTWSSSAPTVLDVNGAGTIHVLAPGFAWISAASEGVRDSVRLTGIVRVARVAIAPRNAVLRHQFSMTLTASLYDAANVLVPGRTVRWRSLSPGIIEIGPGGGAIARGRGTAQVIAESEGRADTVTLTVRLAVSTAIISAVPDTLTLGATRQLSAVLLDSLGDTLTGIPVHWTSERVLVATVDSTGIVRAMGGGSATIDAWADGTVRGRRTVSAGDLVFAEVEAGNQFACGRTTSGDVLCWSHYISVPLLGNPLLPASAADSVYSPTLTAVPGPVARLGSLLQYSVCAVTSGLGTWCWGLNSSHQLGAPRSGPCNAVPNADCNLGPLRVSSSQSFIRVSSGSQHTCALAADSTAWCWGDGAFGRLGEGSQFSGTLVSPSAVMGGHRFMAIEAATYATCGLAVDSLAWCWGLNYGLAPVFVPGGYRFASLDAGPDFYCAITGSGSAYCWGANNVGQLGAGSFNGSQTTPQPVAGGLNFTRISAGTQFACGVDSGYALYCWGLRSNGSHRASPVFIGAGYTSVSSGQSLACATAVSGRVYCWNPYDSDTPLLIPGQR